MPFGKRFLGATLLATLAAGCGGSSPAAGTPPPGAVIVSAENILFVPGSVNAPAGEAFVLYFDNRDTVPHNAKLVDSSGQTIVGGGEPFTGPSARAVDVPALAAGTYKFLCDVHPEMSAVLIAD